VTHDSATTQRNVSYDLTHISVRVRTNASRSSCGNDLPLPMSVLSAAIVSLNIDSYNCAAGWKLPAVNPVDDRNLSPNSASVPYIHTLYIVCAHIITHR
jgi:hypothetical protein